MDDRPISRPTTRIAVDLLSAAAVAVIIYTVGYWLLVAGP